MTAALGGLYKAPRATRVTAALAAVAACVISTSSPSAQAPVARLRPVVGTVVDQQTGQPLRRVRIHVTAAGLSADPVFTTDDGRFELLVPATGPYTVRASKAGFAPAALQPAALSAATPVVRLVRGAVIAGRVVDSFGDPVRTRLTIRGPAGDIVIDTDDRGEYRLGSLPAGRYEISGRSAGMTLNGAAVAAAFTLDSQTVDARAGDETNLTHVDRQASASLAAQAGLPITPRATAAVRAESATVRGRVSTLDGRPVGGAAVMMFRAAGGAAGGDQMRTTMSAADGSFEVADLDAGDYRIRSVKMVSSLFPVDREAAVTVRPGQIVDDVDVRLGRSPTVAGQVVDDYGEPAEGVTVQLWEVRRGPGRSLLLPAFGTPSRRTDDRGNFRLFGAGPAAGYRAEPHLIYLVVSDEPAERQTTDSAGARATRVYYPGVAAIRDAVPVEIASGRDAEGLTIAFGPRATGLVRGFAFDASGGPLAGTVTLRDSVRSGFPIPAERRAAVAGNGSFTFLNVPPGDYVVQGTVGGNGRPQQFAMQYVTVAEGDAPIVTLRTTPGTTLAGRIVTDGDRDGVSLDEFGLSVQRADPDQAEVGGENAHAFVDEEGRFEMTGLHGPLWITGSAPDGWYLRSVSIGATDGAYQPFAFGGTPRVENVEAVFANDAGAVRGRVREAGRPSAALTVLVFSTDRNRWWAPSGYVKVTRSTADGTFGIGSLPPGDYLAAAVDAFDIDSEWLDPEVLASLSFQAHRLTVRPRQTSTVDLDLIQRSR